MHKSSFVNRLSRKDSSNFRKSKMSVISRAETAQSMRLSNYVNKYRK